MSAKMIRMCVQLGGLGIVITAAASLIGLLLGHPIMLGGSDAMAVPTSVCLIVTGVLFIIIGEERACFATKGKP